jgi:hypothetical protein
MRGKHPRAQMTLSFAPGSAKLPAPRQPDPGTMRVLVATVLLVLAAFAVGVFWTRTSAPAPQSPVTSAGTLDASALASVRQDNQLLREQVAALASEVAQLRAALQDRPVTTVAEMATPAQADLPDTPANKPAREALERYRAATGNQRPATLAELVPYFTDPQQAATYLKNREAAATAKPERAQLKAEVKNELKQRLKAGTSATPAP